MKSKLYISLALLLGIVLFINLLSTEYHLRLDLTEGGQYTLSKATKNILHQLQEPVTVKAYFSKDLPPRILKARQDFKDLLIEYANRSNGMVMYKFINPSQSPQVEQQISQDGIRPVMINVREKDQVKQQKAYMGAVILIGKKKEVIPFIRPGAPMEYQLSSAIKKMTIKRKPVIGFLQGQGEPSLAEMSQARQQMDVLYQPQPVTLSDTAPVPAGIRTLAIIAPTDSFSGGTLKQINRFLAGGGRLLAAVNRVSVNMRMGQGMPVTTGLEGWLAKKGVKVWPNFVIDAQCGAVSIPQQQGPFTFNSSISFPYFPMISNFAKNPVTSGLERVLLQFGSSMNYTGDSSMTFIPLAFTSKLSDTLPTPQFINIQRQWSQEDFTKSRLIVAAALEGNVSGLDSAQKTKMVVIGDGDFAVNGPPRQAQQLNPDNVSFLVNAIDWLSDDTGLIGLRTKNISSRPIEQLSDSTKTFLKYLNFLLPVLLAIIYGLLRARQNRIKRLQRMKTHYETAQ